MSRLVIMCGYAGSGKTRASKLLARRFHIPYYDYDTLVQPFLQEIERRNGIGDSRLAFYKDWRDPSYKTLWGIVLENLKLGVDGVLSAPLSSEVRDPQFFSKLRQAYPDLDAQFISVYLVPSPELHLASLIHRKSGRDDEIIENYEEYRKTHPVTEPEWDADKRLYITFNSFEEREEKLAQLLDPLLKGEE